jgi:NhaP-type Na+/H+ or K+/H+ antiporter
MSLSEIDWKTKMLIGGVALGASVGLATAYLLSRTIEERGGDAPDFNTMDTLKVVVGVIGIVRGIAALGSGK